MRALLLAMVTGTLMAMAAQAHFVFVVPDAKDPTKATVVFSDGVEADTNVKMDKIAGLKLTATLPDGKTADVPFTKADHSFAATVPANAKSLTGEVTYGTFAKKGTTKTSLLKYYPGAYIPAISAGQSTGAIGAGVVKIEARAESAGVRFLVTRDGKPVADTEVVVMGEKTEKLKTGADGLTPAVARTGALAVYTNWMEDKAGEASGVKYEAISNYATLVVTVK
jgi:uncharacterized GH25 family protein